MAHRGPEDAATWNDGPVALAYRAHRTTSTTSTGVASAAGGRYRLIGDLRLDNRDDLGRRLAIAPAELDDVSDADLVLKAYVRWGTDAFALAVGDFAVVIWDREARTLTCARDPFGVRPLYTYRDDATFAFASEPKGLLALSRVPKRLNEARLAEYLVLLREDAHATIYDDVFLLGPAEVLTVSPGGTATEMYYELQPEPGLSERSMDDLVEGFRTRFWEAVTCCTRSTVTVGSHLSGGLDSSAVACVAREVLAARGEPLHTFSAVYKGVPESDESAYVDAVVEQGGFIPHVIEGDQIGPFGTLDDLYAVLDDEPVGGNHHIVWALVEQAKASGVGVLLDGLDGDNVVGHGLGYLLQLAREGEWERFAQLAPAVTRRFSGEEHLQPFQHALRSTGRVFAQYGYPALQEFAKEKAWGRLFLGLRGARQHLGISLRQVGRSLVRPALQPRGRDQAPPEPSEINALGLDLVDPDLARRVSLRERIAAADRGSLSDLDPADIREGHRQMLQHPRFARGMTLTNLAAGGFGIESRHPFLYRPLVEYCLGLPPELSLHDGWTRYVLREALRDVLPAAVVNRGGKANHTAAFVSTLTRFEGERLAAWVDEPGALAAFVQPDRLRALHRQSVEADPRETNAARTLLVQVYALDRLLQQKGLA